MTTQPEALRLADALSSVVAGELCNKAAAELRRLQAKTEDLEGAVNVLSGVVSERNQLEAQRDALLEVLMLCQQAGLHKHILNTGESLASVVAAAIKQAEEKQK